MYFRTLGLLSAILLFTSFSVYAASPTMKSKESAATKQRDMKSKGISAADQKAIIELFKGVDKSKYRLQFQQGKQKFGAKRVQMADLQQVRKYTNPAEAAGWIVFVVEGDDVIYVLAVGNSKVESLLGRQKAAQLNGIMAKYQR